MAEISVLICTLNDRIMHVPRILLPECDAVHYVVSFQYTNDMFLDMVPEELRRRKDVTLLSLTESGLCLNRNNALRACPTPYAVIADDDTLYTTNLLHEIIGEFRRDESLDIITFGDNRLAFRISIRTPQFDTRFGLGSEYLSCGEEEVILHQARVHGMTVECREFDDYHNDRSPWDLMAYDKRTRRSWGALQYMKSTATGAFFRILLKSFTLKTTRKSPLGEVSETDANHRIHIEFWTNIQMRWRYFRDMLDGLRYIISHPLNESVAEDIPLDFQPIDIWRIP
ncbi:MAG: glycosyltransferase family A protein [Bacteroidales bacterium]|nr:glycosyltransferase family A protein [Bacteroidales bacterium]